MPGGAATIDAMHERWVAAGVQVLEAPYDAVFGRTVVATDPDGNVLRVSPVD